MIEQYEGTTIIRLGMGTVCMRPVYYDGEDGIAFQHTCNPRPIGIGSGGKAGTTVDMDATPVILVATNAEALDALQYQIDRLREDLRSKSPHEGGVR